MLLVRTRKEHTVNDSRRRYRAIRTKLTQLSPMRLTGRELHRMELLAMFIGSIVGGRSVQGRQVGKRMPTQAKVESRIKQWSRWYQDENVSCEVHFLPFIEPLLAHFADLPLVISVDGSEIGRGCMALMVNLIYQKRAIPLVWTVVQRPKGHMSAEEHIGLLRRFQALIPDNQTVILLGDGEFDSIELQNFLAQQQWQYVCRTAKDTWVRHDGEWIQLDDCTIPDLCQALEDVAFTTAEYGPVTVVIWWDKAHRAPIFLVSNMMLAEEICYWYRRRMRIETFFSDQKSRGFHIHKTHVSNPARLTRILIAACLAYIWMIYLGTLTLDTGLVSTIHRSDRCDLSLFQLGLDHLEHCLNQALEIHFGLVLPREHLLT